MQIARSSRSIADRSFGSSQRTDDDSFLTGLKRALGSTTLDGQTLLTSAQRVTGYDYVQRYLGGLENLHKGLEEGGRHKSGGGIMSYLWQEPLKGHRARIVSLLAAQKYSEVDSVFLVTGDVPRGVINFVLDNTALGVRTVVEPVLLPLLLVNDASICVEYTAYDAVKTVRSHFSTLKSKTIGAESFTRSVAPGVETPPYVKCLKTMKKRILNLKIVKAARWLWSKVPTQHKEVMREELREIKQSAKLEGKAALQDIKKDVTSTIEDMRENFRMACHQPFRFIFRNTIKLVIGGAVFYVARRSFL